MFFVVELFCVKNFLPPKPEPEGTAKNGIQIFPNPANDKLFVISENSFSKKKLQIRVQNLTGKVLKTQYLEDGDLQLEFDISDLPNGIYSISFMTINNEILQTNKLVIMH
ncbi:MAG: T9SS C-terminal target domain-containing protein [Bacteroidetes bacterium]|nr:MAG: T9SS C-terminal target domain-containing protein [Bacteroidota bacterium]